jgi:hypothetical protein
MTVGFPVKALSGNCPAIILASAFLVPSVLLFCVVHKAFDQPPMVLVTRVAVRVLEREPANGSRIESYDPNVSLSLVQEQAVNNRPAVAQNIEPEFSTQHYMSCDSYDGLAAWGADDPVINLVQHVVQLFAYFLHNMPLQTALVGGIFIWLWTAGPVILSKL